MSLVAEHKGLRAVLTDKQEYRLLFAVTFVIFLFAAVILRLFRSLHGDVQPVANRLSLFAEAKAHGYSSLAFAFMG